MCGEMPTGNIIPACPSQKLKREEPSIGEEGGSQRDSWGCEMELGFRREKKSVSELS